MNFELYVLGDPYLGWLLKGVMMTLIITTLTTVLSLILGGVVAGLRTATARRTRCLGIIYINLFRNIPLVPLLLFLVFGFPGLYSTVFGSTFPVGMEFLLLIIGLSLNTSAYIAEIFRSGIRGVHGGHIDAAVVLGLRPIVISMKVIYPEALRICLPALGNRIVHNMKNSTIALVLPLSVDSMEVLGQAGRIAGQTFSWAEPLLFSAAVYLVLAFIMSLVLNVMARRAQEKIEVAR